MTFPAHVLFSDSENCSSTWIIPRFRPISADGDDGGLGWLCCASTVSCALWRLCFDFVFGYWMEERRVALRIQWSTDLMHTSARAWQRGFQGIGYRSALIPG